MALGLTQVNVFKPVIVAVDPKTELAAIKFEQYFIKTMLDGMEKTMPGDGILGDDKQREMMVDMKNQALAESLATSKSFGIADLLMQQAQLNK